MSAAERAKLVYWGCIYKPTSEAFMQSIAAAITEAEQRGYVAGLKAAQKVIGGEYQEAELELSYDPGEMLSVGKFCAVESVMDAVTALIQQAEQSPTAKEAGQECWSTAPEAETEGPWKPRAVRWSEVSIDPPGRASMDTKTRILNAKCAGKSYILESEIIRDLHRNPICHRSEVQEG
jgi:hypothetical protein